MTHSPADVIAQLLLDVGAVTSAPFVGNEPAVPDAVVTVYDTQGQAAMRTMDGRLNGCFGFQVRVRAGTYATGWTRADGIRTALANVYQRTVHVGTSVYAVHAAVGIGNVISIGKESPTSQRSVLTLNALVEVSQVS